MLSLLLFVQVNLDRATELAMKAVPDATWSAPLKTGGGVLLTARFQESMSDSLHKASQGPAKSVVGQKEPPLVSNDQLFLVKTGDHITAWKPWQPLKHSYALFKVDLGTGQGFRWFSRGSLMFANSIRTTAKLKGGDDPLKLAIEGLKSKDRNGVTYGTAYTMLVQGKDASIPLLRKEIAATGSKGAGIPILGQIRTSKAGYELLRLYRSPDQHVREAVQSAAAYRPTLPMLRPVYHDLIKEGEWVVAPTEAAIQYHWTDFLPAIRREWKVTKSPLEAMVLYDAMDTLGPKKLPASVTRAARILRNAGYRPEMQAEFMGCPDPVFRAIIGLYLQDYATKGGRVWREPGQDLLASVPDLIKKPLERRFGK
jgi:hypothetical protein